MNLFRVISFFDIKDTFFQNRPDNAPITFSEMVLCKIGFWDPDCSVFNNFIGAMIAKVVLPYMGNDIKGHNIAEIDKFLKSNDALEYIYTDDVPARMLEKVGEAAVSTEEKEQLFKNNWMIIKSI